MWLYFINFKRLEKKYNYKHIYSIAKKYACLFKYTTLVKIQMLRILMIDYSDTLFNCSWTLSRMATCT